MQQALEAFITLVPDADLFDYRTPLQCQNPLLACSSKVTTKVSTLHVSAHVL